MARKRKADDDEEESPSPKKTARQIREEQKRRAQEWAKQREAKKAAKKAPTAAATKSPTRITRSSPARPTRSSPRRTAAASPARTTRRSAAAAEEAKSPQPAIKRQKLDESGKSATKTATSASKKKKMQESKARAAAWAAQQELDKAKSPRRAARTIARQKEETTPKKKPARKEEEDESMEEESSPEKSPQRKETKKRPAARKQQAAASVAPPSPAPYVDPETGMTPEAQAALFRNQQEILARAQRENNAWNTPAFQQQAQMSPPFVGSPVPAQSPPRQQHQLFSPQHQFTHQMLHHQVMQNAGQAMGYQYAPQQQYNPYAQQAAMNVPMGSPAPGAVLNVPPPVASPPRAKRSALTKTRSPPPQYTLQSPPPAPPPQPTHAAAEPQEDEHQLTAPDDEEQEGSKRSRWLAIGVPLFALSVIMAIVASVGFGNVEKHVEEIVHKVDKSYVPPCFISNPPEEDVVRGNCDRSKGWIHCPDGGICAGGELRSCVDSNFQVSETRDQCVLTAAANETLANVTALLASWTTQHTCTLKGCVHAIVYEDEAAPYFDLSVVTAQVDVSQSLIKMSDDIDVMTGKDGEVIVGLTDEYVTTRLNVPVWCYLGLWMFWFVDVIMKAFWFTIHWASGIALNLTMTFPLASLVCFLFLWGILAYRKRRKQRKKLMQDVAIARDLTYSNLQDNSGKGLVVLYLRDQVAIELYPNSKSNRSYMIHRVWPRVVTDVKLDNRIHKTSTFVDGKRRDVWKWQPAATASAKKTKGTK